MGAGSLVSRGFGGFFIQRSKYRNRPLQPLPQRVKNEIEYGATLTYTQEQVLLTGRLP
jgi:hypothetical protein